MAGFLRYRFGGLIFGRVIHGGAYFRNFTVSLPRLLSHLHHKLGKPVLKFKVTACIFSSRRRHTR